jgi:choline dehydrogenase-like flavoprotein
MLTYNLSDYVKKGFRQARIAAQEYMRRLGAEEFTSPNAAVFGVGSRASRASPRRTAFTFEGQEYAYFGAGHVCGTHVMGALPANSVVDNNQRSWDHSNLYIVGCGSMPSIGSQNPTLTMVALADRTADQIAPPSPRRRSVGIGKA